MVAGPVSRFESSDDVMRYALELARRGIGWVEPNPPVGAVLVNDELQIVGEGWHQRYGGPHAEIHALQQAGDLARGCTLFMTLEPCCHHGKTPPCTQAVIAAGIRRVVVATSDPNPLVAGQGLQELTAAGVSVECGVLKREADALIAPFQKLVLRKLPWFIAKWAMTLDGKVATFTGDSRWISNEASRFLVHELRSRMDAILVGIQTALADDPLLTARPAGARTAVRIVVDRQARLPLTSQLVATARQHPVLVAVADSVKPAQLAPLEEHGVEVLRCPLDETGQVSLPFLCEELGRRRFTNVLVEGGGKLLGSFFDRRMIDEVYAFIAPKIVGGTQSTTPVAGQGIEWMSKALRLEHPEICVLDSDVMIHGRLPHPEVSAS